MLHFVFFNLGHFRIGFCFKSHSTTAPETLSQEKKTCGNSPPGNYIDYNSSLFHPQLRLLMVFGVLRGMVIKLSHLLVQRINEFKINEIQRKTPQ